MDWRFNRSVAMRDRVYSGKLTVEALEWADRMDGSVNG